MSETLKVRQDGGRHVDSMSVLVSCRQRCAPSTSSQPAGVRINMRVVGAKSASMSFPAPSRKPGRSSAARRLLIRQGPTDIERALLTSWPTAESNACHPRACSYDLSHGEQTGKLTCSGWFAGLGHFGFHGTPALLLSKRCCTHSSRQQLQYDPCGCVVLTHCLPPDSSVLA